MTTLLIISLIFIVIVLLIWVHKLRKSLKKHFIIEHALQYEAGHDSLTGLVNGGLAIDRLRQYMENARRYKKRVAILYLGVDHFKKINKSFGFYVGDTVLQLLSKKLLNTVRKSDTVARLNDDEFIIILDNFDNSTYIQVVIDKLMQLSKETLLISYHKLDVTFSLGISVYPDENVDAVTLLNHASTAMHTVKSSGHNNYQFYSSELANKVFNREKLEQDLIQSIKNNELQVYYQLQIDARDDTIIGMEALVRWRHPEMGLILPNQFISRSEEIGYIIDIDKWVMKEAMTQFGKWRKAGLNPGILSLNLSILSLEKNNFIDEIQNTMQEADFDKEQFSFEIMVTQIMHHPKCTIAKLNELSALGIRFSVDDFGTDNASLAYLKRLPINKVKIDRSIIMTLTETEDNKEITKTIISMAKNLNLDVLAEGVETQEQCDFLLEHSCSEIQGYLYHKPSPANEVEKKLDAFL
ncbi:putative bifunctional diguanylate cyclase/phosphodiesterase [Sulfurimonas sp.]|uniref:putative bifunctional diguanylate cyclase/phosphodiesterase n=1 Tax=Sulfurimonas sp. TaxID=2022749 RepID=UPI0039E45332